MLLNIIEHPNDILRKHCAPVKKITKKHQKLIKNMILTMQQNNGIGLAAPQVSVGERIIIVQDAITNKIYSMVNPVITKRSGEKKKSKEGCLSIPHENKVIMRDEFITVEYLTEKGVQKRGDFKPHISFVIQHEIDHLNGVLIIDY